MSDNDKWVWSNEDDPIAALFRSEPSSKAGPGLQIDLMSPESAKTPAASATLGKALALHLQGKPDAALTALSLAVDGGENLAELHAAMGHILFELQRFDEASKSYLKAAQTDPGHKTASYNRGVCLERLERWSEAVEAFQRAIDID